MNNKNKKPNPIEAALGPRMQEEPMPEEPNQDEILAQALSDAGTEERLLSQPEEPTTKPMIPPKSLVGELIMTREDSLTPVVLTGNSLETRVSNCDPQPVTQSSSQELVEPPQKVNQQTEEELEPNWDSELVGFQAYIDGDQFTPSFVSYQLIVICGNPQVIPIMSQWCLPNSLDVSKLVYDVIQSPGYVESIWPVLKILMGLSVNNSSWAAKVAVTLALFDSIKLFPLAKLTEEMKP